MTSDLTTSGSGEKGISLADRLTALRQQAGLSEVLLFRITNRRNGQRMQRLLRVPDNGEARPVRGSVHRALHVAVEMAQPFITMRRERHRDDQASGTDGQLAVVMIAPILTNDSVMWGALVGEAPQGETTAEMFRAVIETAEKIGAQVSSWGRQPLPAGTAPSQVDPGFKMTSATTLLHELRTPLTASSFALETLERDERLDAGDRSIQRALRTLRKGLDEATNIIKWWDEARKKGLIRAHLKPLILAEALNEALELSEYHARQVHVNNSDETLRVLADELMLNRVFLNLIENAFLHGQPGGTLDISISAASGQAHVRFLNKGVIPDSALQQILHPTLQDNIPAEERGHGYGVGIVRALLHTMNGTLQAKSDEQEWIEFTVTLPAALPERAAEM